ncbi:MAG TPA: glycosyltransferase family 87 protein, partial [Bryobacteraceae bacterium]
MSKTPLFFLVLACLLVASRMCHVAILWEGDTLPLAAAQQMVDGKVIYRDVWYDKPVLVPAVHVLWGARPGWPLRLGNALYALLACWIAFAFARDLWSEREGLWAAALLGFFLIFDVPSAVIPVASDLMMLAPHMAAVWMAWKRRPFWSGVWAGVAFWVSPKGLFVAAVCFVWNPAGVALMAAGFAATSVAVGGWLWSGGALGAYWEEVWKWGRLYAGSPFEQTPIRNGLMRTLNWAGFHAATAIAALCFLWRATQRFKWIAWLMLALIGVAAGLRFFPRYYFLLLPVVVLMAARGFTLLGRRRDLVVLLLLIPATRFGPAYLAAVRNSGWRDTAMDRDSRAVAAEVRGMAKAGDTLFVWGYRPEMFVYTRLPAGTMYLDSQPLTGVPADRHLTHSEPVETEAATRRRAELARSHPSFVLDGLSLYNPRLAITNYPDLREWLSHYREV